MPEFKRVLMRDIDEPQLAARCAMDDQKLAELAESMATIGLIEPIALHERDGRYEIEAGHRRYICARKLAWVEIPALVFAKGELAEGAAMLAENIHREDLSAAEEAILFQQTREKYNLDEAGLCERFKVSPGYLGDRIALLRGDERVFQALAARQINFSVARELNKCDDEAHRRYLLQLAIDTSYSARVIEGMVREWRRNQVPQSPAPPPPIEAVEHPAPQPYRMACEFCGGDLDPWELVQIWVHRRELDDIKAALRNAALAG